MSLNIFSQAPYYDDYDENNKYLRVLFRPGVSLQVRELNQLQTYLQSQIERMGLHFFKEGAMVIPGQSSVDLEATYLKLESDTNGVDINTILDDLKGSILVGGTTGVKAKVITASAETNTDPVTLFVRYISSGDDKQTKAFQPGEELSTEYDGLKGSYSSVSGTQRTVQIRLGSGNIGKGAIASVERGIYFTKGQFALVDTQTIILQKYSNTPSCRVGLSIAENIITANTDLYLNDNANGTPNENAPGAHRYQIVLTLSTLDLVSVNDSNFIELIRVDNGTIQSKVIDTEYSILAKTLARRTYDESGHYTVSPFKVSIREHRNNDRGEWSDGTLYALGDIVSSGSNYFIALSAGTSGPISPGTRFDSTDPYQTINDGVLDWNYTENPAFNRGYLSPERGGDEGYVAVAIEPGKAYVQGYEIEKIATEYVKVPKARSFDRINNDAIPVSYGNYIYVTNVHGLPDCSSYPLIELYNQMLPSVNPQTAGTGTKVGTARIRAFEFDSGIPGTTTGVYRAYLFDVAMNPGYSFDRDVKSIFYNTGTTILNIAANVTGVYSSALSGFINVNGTDQVTGNSGANFTTDLKTGDYIIVETDVGNEIRRVTVNNSTSLTTDIPFDGSVSNAVYKRVMTAIQDPGNLPLLFPLAYSFIRRVRGGSTIVNEDGSITSNDNIFATVYTTTQRFDGQTGVGQTSLTIAVGSAINATTLGTEFNPSANKYDYVVVNKTDGVIVTPSDIELQNNGVEALISGLDSSKSYSVFAPVRKSDAAGQEKTKKLQTNQTIDFLNQVDVTPIKLSLKKADGYRIVAIKMADGFGTASSNPDTTTDITNWYTFDNGQRDTHYDVATITRKDGYPVPTGAVRVIFDYFSHSAGTAGDYFTVGSYLADLPYHKIPYYVSSNGVIALSDVLDFRPRIGDIGTLFNGTGASATEVPKIGFETSTSYSYYLPRSDKLALDVDGKFFTVDGVPSLSPEEPKDPNLGMLLAKMHFAAYTTVPEKGSVQIETVDTKRYTMRDIGKLDKRIENLEYYTALSLLEQETKSLTIQDDGGLDRYKNGFIVDSFKGQDLGDVGSVDYRCAIDMSARELRPFYTMSNVNLLEEHQDDTTRAASAYALTGDIITLPYTHVELIKQPFASRTENVNPFAIFTFLGSMSLNPPSDEWFEVNRRPDIINNVEGNFSAVQTAAEATGVLGTVWNAWETNWVGQTRNIDRLVVTRGFDSRDYGLGAGRWMDRRTFTQAELEAIGGDATSFGNGAAGARVLTFQTQATTVGQSRTGISTSVVPKIDYQVLEDRVLQSALIPYIRSRELLFVCKGLKPNTKLKPFFDDTDISLFITPATKIAITPTINNPAGDDGNGQEFLTDINVGGAAEEYARQVDGKAEASYNKGDVVYVKERAGQTYSNHAISPATAIAVLTEKSVEFNNNTNSYPQAVYVLNIKGAFQNGDVIKGSISGAEYTIVDDVVVSIKAGDIVTNFNGSVAGVFSIPNSDSIRFRTGIRDFKLTDSNAGGLDFTTQGRTQYRAQGILETRQKTINAVRNAEIVSRPVSESRVTEVYSDERLVRDTGWYDPLAQTFLVQSNGGSFLTKVDIFFATKDIGIPVTLQIREVINGYPGSKVLPFSRVTLTPDKVNVDESGMENVATTFKFESPVYLQDNTEYCIVLLSDSNNYRVWISQLGEKNIGTDRFISEQPYAGVLFKSQNASTWTANQEQDLKFTIWAAEFNTASQPNILFNNEPLPPVILGGDPFQTTNGLSKVRVLHPNHGMLNNSMVIISNVEAGTYNGIVTTVPTVSEPYGTGLNGKFTISDADLDSYIIDVGTNATLSGFVGGSYVVATENVSFDAVNLIAQAQTFSETTLAFSVNTTNEQYNKQTEEVALVPALTTYFTNPNVVASQVNENESSLAQTKSLTLHARLTSKNKNVSPVIDTSRLSLTTIKNRIDNENVTTKNIDIIDDKVVLDAVTNVTFNTSSPNTITIPVAVQPYARSIRVGKYITISGTTNNNTVDPILVTAVAADGSSITIEGKDFVTESPANTTIKMKDNFISEIAPSGGSAAAKYLTRVINLENQSTFLKIMFAANIPAVTGTDVEVWYKLLPAGSTTDISQFNFVRATVPVKEMVKTSNANTFTDVEFDLTDLPAYDAVVVKLVMKSGNSAQVPRIKDLRVICCA
jgi:hypothetical protein